MRKRHHRWLRMLFHHTLHFTSIKQWMDFENSIWFKLLIRTGLFDGTFFSPVGLSVELTSKDDFVPEQIERVRCSNFKPICEFVHDNLGKSIYARLDNCEYVLQGLEVTQDDYYYIVKSLNPLQCNRGRILCNSKVVVIG